MATLALPRNASPGLLSSLRFRIALPLVALVAAAVFVPGAWFLYQSAEIVTARAHERNLLAAQLAAHDVDLILRHRMAAVTGIARLETIRSLKRAAVDAEIGRIRAREIDFTSLFVLDAEGRVVSFVDRPQLVGADLSFRTYFQVPRNEARTFFSDSTLTVVKTITVIAAAPILGDDGTVSGVLAGSFDVHLKNFNEVVLNTRIGETGHAYLVDRRGVLVTHPDTARALAQEDLGAQEPVKAALAGASGTTRYRFDGKEMLAAFAPVPASGWGIVVQQPLEEALAPLQALQRRLVLAGVACTLLAALLGIYAAVSVTRPLRQLTRQAAAIGLGDLQARIAVHDRGEVGVLAATLESMRAELLRAATALRTSETQAHEGVQRLDQVTRAGHVGLWDWDLATNRVRYSDEWKRQLGHEPHEIGDDFAEWQCRVHPEDLEAALATVQRYLREPWPDYRIEFRMRHKDGSYRWILAYAELEAGADGKPARMLGSHVDITERRRAEAALRVAHDELERRVAERTAELSAANAALRESEERLRRVSENASVGLVRCSRDLRYLSANPAYAAIAGRPLQEIVGRPIAEVLGPAVLDALRAHIERVLGGERFEFETELPRAGGGSRYLHVSYSPDEHPAGEIVGWVACVTDLTERRRLEEELRRHRDELEERVRQRTAALREAHERIANTIATSPGIVCSFRLRPDGSACFPFGSERIAETCGMPAGPLAEDAAGFFAAVHPDDIDGLRESIAQSARHLSAWRREWRVRHPARGELWIEGHSVPQREPDGGTLWHGVATDITERKLAEQALRESERRLAALIANLPGIVYRCRNDERYTTEFVSEGMLALSGYPAQEFMAGRRHPGELIHPQDRERVWRAVQAALAGNAPYEIEYRLVSASGEEKWVWERGAGVRGPAGEVLALEGFVTDITERKRAEAVLAESAARLQLAIRAASLYPWSWEAGSGRVTRSRFLDEGPQHSEISYEALQALVHPEDRAHFVAAGAQALAGGEGYEVDFRVVARHGAVRWMDARGTLVRDADGRPLRMIGMARDITERKRAEERLREFARRLSSVQEDERRLIARALHDDIGQALTAVHLNLQAVRRSREAAPRARAIADALAITDEAIERVRSMSLDLRPQALDDLGLAPALHAYCERQSARGATPIAFEADAATHRLKGPAALACYRIAQEAITNALRHAKPGRIHVGLRRRDGVLVLEVADNGAGFDARAKDARDGLGVAGMRERAEQAGGRLSIQSGPRRGTRVRVEFAKAQ